MSVRKMSGFLWRLSVPHPQCWTTIMSVFYGDSASLIPVDAGPLSCRFSMETQHPSSSMLDHYHVGFLWRLSVPHPRWCWTTIMSVFYGDSAPLILNAGPLSCRFPMEAQHPSSSLMLDHYHVGFLWRLSTPHPQCWTTIMSVSYGDSASLILNAGPLSCRFSMEAQHPSSSLMLDHYHVGFRWRLSVPHPQCWTTIMSVFYGGSAPLILVDAGPLSCRFSMETQRPSSSMLDHYHVGFLWRLSTPHPRWCWTTIMSVFYGDSASLILNAGPLSCRFSMETQHPSSSLMLDHYHVGFLWRLSVPHPQCWTTIMSVFYGDSASLILNAGPLSCRFSMETQRPSSSMLDHYHVGFLWRLSVPHPQCWTTIMSVFYGDSAPLILNAGPLSCRFPMETQRPSSSMLDHYHVGFLWRLSTPHPRWCWTTIVSVFYGDSASVILNAGPLSCRFSMEAQRPSSSMLDHYHVGFLWRLSTPHPRWCWTTIMSVFYGDSASLILVDAGPLSCRFSMETQRPSSSLMLDHYHVGFLWRLSIRHPQCWTTIMSVFYGDSASVILNAGPLSCRFSMETQHPSSSMLDHYRVGFLWRLSIRHPQCWTTIMSVFYGDSAPLILVDAGPLSCRFSMEAQHPSSSMLDHYHVGFLWRLRIPHPRWCWTTIMSVFYGDSASLILVDAGPLSCRFSMETPHPSSSLMLDHYHVGFLWRLRIPHPQCWTTIMSVFYGGSASLILNAGPLSCRFSMEAQRPSSSMLDHYRVGFLWRLSVPHPRWCWTTIMSEVG